MRTSDPLVTSERQAAWAAYQKMRIHLHERLNRELARQTGLSEADYGILSALSEAGSESVRVLALRCGLGWEKSRLSHQLRRMEERGLISRDLCDEDNRGSMVALTPTGRELAAQARDTYDAAIQRYVYDRLSPAQFAALDGIATSILAGLDLGHQP